jgi:hypothetical protein
MNFDSFKDEYQDLASDVSNASHKTVQLRLQDWLALLDTSEISSNRIKELESLSDFSGWYENAKRSVGSMVGSGKLKLDADKTQRLGQYLWLFRHFSNQEDAILDFSMNFAYARNFDDAVNKVNNEYFDPFSRDLLRDLERQTIIAPEIKSASEEVIIDLDHEDEPYKNLIEQIEKLQSALAQSNELGALSGREAERVVAEVNSGRDLLAAKSVRVRALSTVLIPALTWIANNFGAGILGALATALLTILAAQFGMHIPGIG